MPPERSAAPTMSATRPSLATRLEPIVVWLAPLALVLVWAVVVRQVDPGGILPTPAGVARGLVELLGDGRLHRALLHSSVHILTGFGLATAAAIPLGALTAMSGRAEEWLRPLVETFRPIAPYAWVPMATPITADPLRNRQQNVSMVRQAQRIPFADSGGDQGRPDVFRGAPSGAAHRPALRPDGPSPKTEFRLYFDEPTVRIPPAAQASPTAVKIGRSMIELRSPETVDPPSDPLGAGPCC